MSTSTLIRYSLSISAAVLLANCGGSQPPIGAPGAMLQRASIANARQASSSGNDLLYVLLSDGKVDILTYPGLAYVNQSDSVARGMCSNSAGDVFLTWYEITGGGDTGYIAELAPGGTKTIRTWSYGHHVPGRCSADPTTGNLAVTDEGSDGNVAIFHAAKGRPTYYTASGFKAYAALAYDDRGNLFITGSDAGTKKLAELPKSSSKFRNITMKSVPSITGLQWDGKYLAFLVSKPTHATVDRVEVSGSTGRVVGITRFNGLVGKNPGGPSKGAFWIGGGYVVLPPGDTRARNPQELDLWNYPAGGDPVATATVNPYVSALTVGVGSSR
jgi:hypothetical protein